MPQHQSTFEAGVAEVQASTGVDHVQQALIGVVAGSQAEAHEVQPNRCNHLEARISLHPRGEGSREVYMSTDVMSQPFRSVVADDEPQLESPEAPAERDLPIAIRPPHRTLWPRYAGIRAGPTRR
jgi:hypothetical protein